MGGWGQGCKTVSYIGSALGCSAEEGKNRFHEPIAGPTQCCFISRRVVLDVQLVLPAASWITVWLSGVEGGGKEGSSQGEARRGADQRLLIDAGNPVSLPFSGDARMPSCPFNITIMFRFHKWACMHPLSAHAATPAAHTTQRCRRLEDGGAPQTPIAALCLCKHRGYSPLAQTDVLAVRHTTSSWARRQHTRPPPVYVTGSNDRLHCVMHAKKRAPVH